MWRHKKFFCSTREVIQTETNMAGPIHECSSVLEEMQIILAGDRLKPNKMSFSFHFTSFRQCSLIFLSLLIYHNVLKFASTKIGEYARFYTCLNSSELAFLSWQVFVLFPATLWLIPPPTPLPFHLELCQKITDPRKSYWH